MFKTELDWVSAYKKLEAELENKEKQIATLEETISVLLSCKNCPENKGGYICQKEYEDKCLTQKIQYIKELKEENEKLKADYEVLSCSVGDFDELQDKLEEEQRKNNGLSDNLTKAKDILQRLMENQPTPSSMYAEIDLVGWREVNKEAEQFLNEVEK